MCLSLLGSGDFETLFCFVLSVDKLSEFGRVCVSRRLDRSSYIDCRQWYLGIAHMRSQPWAGRLRLERRSIVTVDSVRSLSFHGLGKILVGSSSS